MKYKLTKDYGSVFVLNSCKVIMRRQGLATDPGQSCRSHQLVRHQSP